MNFKIRENCTRENKDTTFDHKIAKFDTRENFHLYGIFIIHNLITYIFYVSLTLAINILIHYAQIFLLYIAYGWMPEQLTESSNFQ